MYNLQSDKEKYYLLGRIIKTYRYRGELIFHLDVDDPQSYSDLEMVFINTDQSLVPWFINEITIEKDRAFAKLDDLENLEDARRFVGRELYLPVDKLPPGKKKEFYFHKVIGFRAVDESHGDIGIVTEILERPEQKIIRIMKGDKEILVPLTEEMISKIDSSAKILYLQTPGGLINLYLE
jgi:16S rRNA processing protein RimM